MALFTLGINHRTAPLSVREQLAFHAEELRRALADLASGGRVHEAAILSTCNRTELYLEAESPQAVIAWLGDYRRACLEMRLRRISTRIRIATRCATLFASPADSIRWCSASRRFSVR